MTDRAKKYLELSEKMDIAFNNEDDALDEQLSKEFADNKQQMTVEELKSLEGHISAREYYLAIVPLIKSKQA